MEEFKACTTAFHNWSREIINSIVYGYNNDMEGANNVIKVNKKSSRMVRELLVFMYVSS